MKRRVLTQALLMGLVARGVPAFAANPLPALQETPGLAEKVKSGALPPVDKRLPEASPRHRELLGQPMDRASTAASSTCWSRPPAIPA